MKEIILATNNQNKVREMKQKLSSFDIKVLSLKEAGIDVDVEETGETFKENAEIKADAIYEMLKKPVIADDSGLCIDALDGAPGVHSHRFAGEEATDADRINLVLEKLKDVPKEKRTARFKCCVCYIDENGEKHFFEEKAEGIIGYEPKGTNGFGFDPIFHYEGDNRSFAEYSPEEKNAVSHRGKAVARFIEFITK
ncbi:MAG: XTP/dITP diphosphatase [Clostridia bacterium]|nr:XTP/dITP diphosphatase [Clostridia bacterium]